LTAAAVWLGISRPQVLAELLYACQPGAVVLAAALVVRWVLQRRYRRQVLFLPGFTRPSGSGSALVRGGTGGSRPRREPSTIDAPTGPGSFSAS
jgi:hypothetical protein